MQVSYTIWLTDRGYNRPNDHESTGENSPKPGRGTEAVEPEKEVSHSMTFWLVKNRIPWMGNTSSSREPKVALTRFCLGTRSLFTALSLFGTCLFHREQEVRLQILRIADQAQVQAAHFPKRRCLASTHFVPLNNTTCFVCRNQKPGIANTRIGRLREFYDATLNKLDSLVGFPFFKATKLVSERMVWGWVVSLRGSRFKPEQKWPRDAWLEFGCPESKPSDLAPTMEFNKKNKTQQKPLSNSLSRWKTSTKFWCKSLTKVFVHHPSTTSTNSTKRRSADFFNKAVPPIHLQSTRKWDLPTAETNWFDMIGFLGSWDVGFCWSRGRSWSGPTPLKQMQIGAMLHASMLPCTQKAASHILPRSSRQKQSKLNRFTAEFCWTSGRYAENALRISPASSNGEAPHVAL